MGSLVWDTWCDRRNLNSRFFVSVGRPVRGVGFAHQCHQQVSAENELTFLNIVRVCTR